MYIFAKQNKETKYTLFGTLLSEAILLHKLAVSSLSEAILLHKLAVSSCQTAIKNYLEINSRENYSDMVSIYSSSVYLQKNK